MVAICNEGCNKQFELNNLKEIKHDNGVIETYFKCPYCGKKYICCYTDNSIRLKQKKLDKLWKRYRTLKTQGQLMGTLKMIKKLKAEIKKDMDDLKNKMLSKEE